MEHIPPVPNHSFRIVITQPTRGTRLDSALMEALRAQDQKPELKSITRTKFKELFAKRKVQIKGQVAKPASTLEAGTTYVDILE